MADEKKVVSECEYKEVNSEQQNEAPKAENPAEEKKEKKKGVPKWLKTAGQVTEAVAAAFGAAVGGLLILGKVTESRRQKKYNAWQQSQQTPTYTSPERTTTFQQEFHEGESQI